MSCKPICKLCDKLVLSQSVTFTGGNKVELKWNKVRERIEELIAKGTFLSDEDKEILESRYLEVGAEEPVPLLPPKKELTIYGGP